MEGVDTNPRLGTERYAIRRPIGGGATGLVYEAWDRQRKQAVAVKTLIVPKLWIDQEGAADGIARLETYRGYVTANDPRVLVGLGPKSGVGSSAPSPTGA